MTTVSYLDILCNIYPDTHREELEETYIEASHIYKLSEMDEFAVEKELVDNKLDYYIHKRKIGLLSCLGLIIRFYSIKKAFHDFTVEDYVKLIRLELIKYITYKGKSDSEYSIASYVKYLLGNTEAADKLVDMTIDTNYWYLIIFYRINPKIIEEIDVEYFPRNINDKDKINLSFLTTNKLLKAGVKPSTMLPELTKKEANKLLSIKYFRSYSFAYLRIPSVIFTDIAHNRFVESNTECVLINSDNEVREFMHYEDLKHSAVYLNNWNTFKWAVKHKEKLKKTERYMTSKGIVATVYYNRIMECFRKDTAKDKYRYTFKQAYEKYIYEIKKEIEKAIIDNIPLAKFPYNLKDSRIKQLMTSFELLEEGKRMNHCVVSYSELAHRGECYIFHVDDGTELGATVEIVDRDGEWRVKQAMGYVNNPSMEAHGIVTKALEEINKEL